MIPSIPYDELPTNLRDLLSPRVERLGYLGGFFQQTAHQPDALAAWIGFTEAAKAGLDPRLVEVIALTVATWTANDYERHQHERLSLTLGLTLAWVLDVEALTPDQAVGLAEDERAVQGLALAAIAHLRAGAPAELASVRALLGDAAAVAALFVIGRFVAHALIANTLQLEPPVPSIVDTSQQPRRTSMPPSTTTLEPIWIREADVVSLLDMGSAIEALGEGLALEARGDAANLPKTYVRFEVDGPDGEPARGDLHALGATMQGAGLVGTKTWTHTPGGATPLLILFDAATGALRAIIEAFALGQLRTAAVSGVATGALAAADADVMAIVGTGKQALPQVAAVVAVRPITTVRVAGRDPARAAAFADLVTTTLGVGAEVAPSIAAACDGADVITTATRASEPFLTADFVTPGTHVNSMGAIAPDRAEVAASLLERCDVLTSDSVEQARRLSRPLREFLGEDDHDWKRVEPLSALLSHTTTRPADADVTLLTAMGMGISDLALGLAVYESVVRNHLGTPLEAPTRLAPRLRSRGAPRIGYV